MLFAATQFAAQAHDGQYRKGTRIPYLVHPMRVAATLSHAGLDDEVVAAGILHDTIEDTWVTLPDLEAAFPQKTCRLVLAASEPDKSRPWEERKEHTIATLSHQPIDALCLICADKIDNIASIFENLQTEGDATWRRFNRGREKQQWYYTTVLSELKRLSAAELPGKSAVNTTADFKGREDSGPEKQALARLVGKLERAVNRVFNDNTARTIPDEI